MVPLPSSLMSKLPSLATVIPTGRPQTLPSGMTCLRQATAWQASGREDSAVVFGGALVASVQAQVKRSRVRLHEHIWDDDFVRELRMFPFVARVGVIPDVEPRPAVKAAWAHTANVIGR